MRSNYQWPDGSGPRRSSAAAPGRRGREWADAVSRAGFALSRRPAPGRIAGRGKSAACGNAGVDIGRPMRFLGDVPSPFFPEALKHMLVCCAFACAGAAHLSAAGAAKLPAFCPVSLLVTPS